MDAALYRFARRRRVPAAVPRAGVPGSAGGEDAGGMSGTRLYLLDVEGTVAPISLVYEKMFPYARAHLSAYLAGHWDEVATDLELLLVENRAETDARAPRMDAGAEPIEYLLWLMDVDRKSTALKSLQGKVWKAGFESGAVTGEVFADVPGALERWSRRGLVAIYSSGSVEAQRLFFRYSSAGDLTREPGPRAMRRATGGLRRRWGLLRGTCCFSRMWCGNWTRRGKLDAELG